VSGGITYVVYAPGFDENSGGTIFMHELVNALNRRGERARLWPMAPIYPQRRRQRLLNLIRPPAYRLSPDLDTPRATRADLAAPDCVVVYPELVPGNPLQARNVVRWLLYTPGVMHPYAFGPDEMFFCVDGMFDLPEVTGGAPELFLYKINPAYRDEGRPGRHGACYMLRKGKDKPRIPQTDGAELLDGRSHAEIAEAFNRCEVFYSYDEATMYSQYAALCGCLSVVVPGAYADRAQWVANYQIARHGIAYGLDPAELDHARATRHRVIELLRAKEAEGLETVARFVALTRARFAAGEGLSPERRPPT
jgi:hypothetical protein